MAAGRGLFRLHDCPSDFFDNLRDNGISETPQAVHPTGNPISHSTHDGFRLPGMASLKYPVVRFVAALLGLIPFRSIPSIVDGVGNILTKALSGMLFRLY